MYHRLTHKERVRRRRVRCVPGCTSYGLEGTAVRLYAEYRSYSEGELLCTVGG